MKRPLQASIFNILGGESQVKSITRSRSQEISEKFAAAEGNPNAFAALVLKYPKDAGRRYRMVLQSVIDGVNENVFAHAGNAHKGEVLRGLLAGLADIYDRSFWLLVIHSFGHAPLTNLSRCQICNGFFLRARKDQKCCGKECANLFRVRKWRQKYSESYKAQRYRHAESAKGGK